jgi:hypothetical protein
MRRPPRLEPMFPVPPFTPQSACPHYGPIRRGSPFVCSVCHVSPFDHWDFFLPDPLVDPKPDRKPRRRGAKPKPSTILTRKQRRYLQFGDPCAPPKFSSNIR